MKPLFYGICSEDNPSNLIEISHELMRQRFSYLINIFKIHFKFLAIPFSNWKPQVNTVLAVNLMESIMYNVHKQALPIF